jgi:RNA polymerase sigma-70 factor (ECF subfamily)
VDALKELYTRERKRFLSYLVRRTGDYELSCDIMQESFLRLAQKYAPERLSAQLLYTVGRNLVWDGFRQRKRQLVALDEANCPDNRHEHQLLVNDQYRRVLDAMQHLEADERDLLSLVISSELGYREIAEITGLTEANIKVKIHRARKKLKDHLGLNDEGPTD